MTNIEKLQELVQRLHGCDATHVMTIPILETFEGKTIWQGEVELFSLRGHPSAIACYAWTFIDDHQVNQFSAVLKTPPIASAADAVRADIVARVKNAIKKAERR